MKTIIFLLSITVLSFANAQQIDSLQLEKLKLKHQFDSLQIKILDLQYKNFMKETAFLLENKDADAAKIHKLANNVCELSGALLDSIDNVFPSSSNDDDWIDAGMLIGFAAAYYDKSPTLSALVIGQAANLMYSGNSSSNLKLKLYDDIEYIWKNSWRLRKNKNKKTITKLFEKISKSYDYLESFEKLKQ